METKDHKAILRRLEIEVEEFVNWCRGIRDSIIEEKFYEQAPVPSESDSNETIGTLPESKAKFVVAPADEFCSGEGVAK